MSPEEIKQKLQALCGLSCVVASSLPSETNTVSFSIRGNLQHFEFAGYYRLNVSTVSFLSFKAEDVLFVEDSRIELK